MKVIQNLGIVVAMLVFATGCSSGTGTVPDSSVDAGDQDSPDTSPDTSPDADDADAADSDAPDDADSSETSPDGDQDGDQPDGDQPDSDQPDGDQIDFEEICGEVTPPTENAIFETWRDCLCRNSFAGEEPSAESECILCGLYRCENVMGGLFQGLGSAFVQPTGIVDGTCLAWVSLEVEGIIDVYRCQFPIPMERPDFLNSDLAFTDPAEIAPYCDLDYSCNIDRPEGLCTKEQARFTCFSSWF